MKKIILLITVMISCWQYSFCQNVPGVQTSCSTASQGTAGNFVISYTIGEMPLVQSWKSNGLLITQGVLQPLTSTADPAYDCFSQTEVRIFPNPNPGTFSLQLSLLKKGSVKTILTDVTGRQLQQDEFIYSTFTTKQYNITRLPNAVYFLQLLFTETGSNQPKRCVYTIEKLN